MFRYVYTKSFELFQIFNPMYHGIYKLIFSTTEKDDTYEIARWNKILEVIIYLMKAPACCHFCYVMLYYVREAFQKKKDKFGLFAQPRGGEGSEGP